MAASNCPASLKPISHYLILAVEHDKRKICDFWVIFTLYFGNF